MKENKSKKNGSKENGSKKKRMIGIVCAVAAVLIIIAAVIGISLSGGSKSKGLAETYAMAIPSGEHNDTNFVMKFDRKAGTYSDEMTSASDSMVFDSGTFTLEEKDGETVVRVTAEDGDTEDFLLDGEYLMAEGYFYDGTIPDGKTFDAVCAFTGASGSVCTITFAEDGTYTEETVYGVASGEKGGESMETTGTYERDGRWIKRTADNGSTLIDFLIYNGRITNSYYIAE